MKPEAARGVDDDISNADTSNRLGRGGGVGVRKERRQRLMVPSEHCEVLIMHGVDKDEEVRLSRRATGIWHDSDGDGDPEKRKEVVGAEA